MSYFMWTQHWPVTQLRSIDREARKIIVEGGGKHPQSSTARLYLPRDKGGRGLRSIEHEYKITKIKAAIKICSNTNPTIVLVRKFEERAQQKGFSSVLKEASKFARELGIILDLEYPSPSCETDKGEVVREPNKIKKLLKTVYENQLKERMRDEAWQGRLLKARWEDESLSHDNCFTRLKEWTTCPTHTVAGMVELYEQLLPTRMYTALKTKTSGADQITCRLCGKQPESVPHILSGCPALAQTKYLSRHNAALKILFFVIIKDLGLIDEVPSWYSQIGPKPLYSSNEAQAYWDVPVYAEHHEVRANRIDATIIDHQKKEVITLEMSCPWITNRQSKDEEKTLKYAPLRWELKQRFPGYEVQQHNIVIDVLGGWSKEMDATVGKLVGGKAKLVLGAMQKSIISSTLNIARTFKVAS